MYWALSVLVGVATLLVPHTLRGESVPDALSVEWQGQKPCEKLFEDAQIRIARCTFPPGLSMYAIPTLATSATC